MKNNRWFAYDDPKFYDHVGFVVNAVFGTITLVGLFFIVVVCPIMIKM